MSYHIPKPYPMMCLLYFTYYSWGTFVLYILCIRYIIRYDTYTIRTRNREYPFVDSHVFSSSSKST